MVNARTTRADAIPTLDSLLLDLPYDDPRWRELIERDDRASIYHDPEWSRLLADCYGYRPGVVGIVGSSGELAAALPYVEVPWRPRRGRLVALPFSDHVPPLAIDQASYRALLDALIDRYSRPGAPPFHLHATLHSHDEAVTYGPSYWRHEVVIGPDRGAMFDRCDRTRVRQPLERSLAGDLEVEVATGVDEYYRLHRATRRRHGTIPQPPRFFTLLHERLIAPGHGAILLARLGGVAVAGSVFVWNRARIEYKYNASDPIYWNRSPNHLLLWHGLIQGLERGCRLLDLGRTDTHAEGLRVFKASWGGEESTLSYAVIGVGGAGRRSRMAERVASVIGRLPGGIPVLAGRLLYKRLG